MKLKKFRLNRKQSIIFVAGYGFITMVLRFFLEPYLAGYTWISILIGLYLLVLLYTFKVIGFINFDDEKLVQVHASNSGK